jgi:RNA polymerase sigma factor (sigma-70 family)
VVGHNSEASGVYRGMRDWTSCSDAELLAATGSDRQAFACFYDRYEGAVVGYLMRRTRDVDRTADLVSETFAAALAGAARYRPGGPTAAAWLFAIAHNMLLKSVRGGRVQEEARRRIGIAVHLELTQASRDRIDATLASDAWVDDLLARLPPDQREAIRAYVVDDRSYTEIAAQHHTSEAVARKRVSRGLATLRRGLRRTT